MQELLNQILPILISIVATVTLVAVGWSGFKLKDYLIENIGTEQLDKLEGWALVFVRAAEQMFGTGTGKGEEKYNFAADRFVKAVNKHLKLDLDQEEVRSFIESAVIEFKKGWEKEERIVIEADDVITGIKDVEEKDVSARVK